MKFKIKFLIQKCNYQNRKNNNKIWKLKIVLILKNKYKF